MKILPIVLVLAGTAFADQCEVLELTNQTRVESDVAVTQSYGATKVTTGGGSYSTDRRVYTVRLNKSIYQIAPGRKWFPRLEVGKTVECRLHKDDLIIKDGYHYSILAEKPAN